MRRQLNCTAVIVSCVAAWAGVLAQPTEPDPSERLFRVFVGGREIGNERVKMTSSADGWVIQSTGALRNPIDLALRKLEVRYDSGWKPRQVVIDSSLRGELSLLRTSFDGTTASSQMTEGIRQSTQTDQISPDAVVLLTNFYAPYEALAARLATSEVGAEVPIYVAPNMEIPLRVVAVSDERISTPTGVVQTRRYRVTFANPSGPLEVAVWIDSQNRLVRLFHASTSVEVVRDDVASVAARAEMGTRAGDEQVNVPGIGFNLAATISKPTAAPDKRGWPALILVPGSGALDRDATVAGIPVFGQLAGSLADAGFLVVRYDRRGSGQSGGRTEVAALSDYAEDVRSIVKYLQDRRDVDDRRIGLIGHGEGGWVALYAASKEKRVASVVLTGTAGATGAELILEQQARVLDQMGITDVEKQAKIDLQKKIQAAVISSTGWEGIPEALRKQADTVWFRSFLTFDPMKVMKETRQPILILHGELDRQAPVHHADKLAELARTTRKNAGRVELMKLPAVNHLLVSATTGDVDE